MVPVPVPLVPWYAYMRSVYNNSTKLHTSKRLHRSNECSVQFRASFSFAADATWALSSFSFLEKRREEVSAVLRESVFARLTFAHRRTVSRTFIYDF